MSSSLNWLLETGLSTVQSALATAQQTLRKIDGQPKEAWTEPPLAGPVDMDLAVSDFMNRMARVVRYMPKDASGLATAPLEVFDAARRAFGNVETGNAAALPANLALSFGSLIVQTALRGVAALDIAGPSQVATLFRNFYELWTDAPVFVGLEYKEVLEKCQARVEQSPDDHGTRLELGRTLMKCGLYDEAEVHLAIIPPDSFFYSTARHEITVSLLRSGRYERAMHAGVKAMDADPDNERVQLLTWIAAQNAGGYADFVAPAYRMEMRAGYAPTNMQFEEIAAKIGLDKTSGGRGMAIFDYDNDGYLDIVITASLGGCSLYHNNGDGTFTDVSVGSGIDTCVNAFGVTAADYNNDGFIDLFISRLGFYAGEAVLFRNNGDGTFTDVTREAGLSVWGPAFSSSWVDYDNDGFLDLFIANNLSGLFDRKTPNRLFHNNGDGTFTEVTEQSGIKTEWPSISGAWGDYNNDGLPDLFISNGLGHSQLYRNNGDGTFTDVSKEAGVTRNGFGSPAFFWDYDDDGWLDICQFTWSDHENAIYTMKNGEAPPNGGPMRVYHNNRDGTFSEIGRDIGLNGCWGTMSGNAGDFNNDGHLDLVLGNGSPKMDRFDPLVLMETDGTKFQNITFSAGLPFTGKSHGANIADLFGDGRLSILVAAGGVYPADLWTCVVYCPKTLPGNYLNVRLRGVKSNRSAIGARICLQAGGRKQYRVVSGGSNFGCLPLEQHFGLAQIEAVDGIEIKWPSGLTQRFSELPVNKTLQFTEGEDGWNSVYRKT